MARDGAVETVFGVVAHTDVARSGSLRDLPEIGVVKLGAIGIFRRSELLFADEAEAAVVEDDDREAHALADGGQKLEPRDGEAAVSEQRDDGAFRPRDLRADRRRQSEAHRLQIRRQQEAPWRASPEVAAGQHLVQAGVEHQAGLVRHRPPQGGEELLDRRRIEAAHPRLPVGAVALERPPLPGVDLLLRPRGRGAAGRRGLLIEQRPNEPGRVGENRHRRLVVRAQNIGGGVDVDQPVLGQLEAKAVGAVVRKLAAHRENEVAARDELVQRLGASAIEGDDPRMILGEDAPRRGRRDDRDAEGLDEGAQLLGRPGDALADVEERAARLREAAFEVAKRRRRRRGNRQLHGPRSARLRPEIDGNVDDHRARFPGGAERVGFDQDLLDSIRRGDVDDALDERREDGSLVERLELKSPVGRRGRLPQDVDERRRIEIRLRDAGQGVCESGTGNRDENARPTRRRGRSRSP